MKLRALFVILALLWPAAALAQLSQAQVGELFKTVRLADVLQIMAEESAKHGAQLDASMLEGQGGPGWARIIDGIHDPSRWEQRLQGVVASQLAPEEFTAIQAFFSSAQGQALIDLEVSARRALMDEAVEEASRQRMLQMRGHGDDLVALVARFIEVNNLIDANVVGALNANMAFFDGLAEGSGAPAAGGTTQDVWAQEPEIRANTEDWAFTFLTMAYAPLPDGELDTYIAFSESPAGQAYNRALFVAFDEMFVATSRALGRALGKMLVAEEL